MAAAPMNLQPPRKRAPLHKGHQRLDEAPIAPVQIEKLSTINGEIQNGCRDRQQKSENQVSLVAREQACIA